MSVGAERARTRRFNAAQSGNINLAPGESFFAWYCAISVGLYSERITTDLCHPLQEGLQPVDIALAVAVEECEDRGRGSIRSFHARPHQAWNDSLKHCHQKGTTNLMLASPNGLTRAVWRKAISRHTEVGCNALLNGKMRLSRLSFPLSCGEKQRNETKISTLGQIAKLKIKLSFLNTVAQILFQDFFKSIYYIKTIKIFLIKIYDVSY